MYMYIDVCTCMLKSVYIISIHTYKYGTEFSSYRMVIYGIIFIHTLRYVLLPYYINITSYTFHRCDEPLAPICKMWSTVSQLLYRHTMLNGPIWQTSFKLMPQ